MPAAYAHYRFGGDCLQVLPEEIRSACLAYRDVFDFGVHGPDIFFYYHPFGKNPVNRFGSELHHHTGGEFFRRCAPVYRAGEDRDAMTAYLFGFLAHFALDSACHAYINGMDRPGLSHNHMEAQYEAFLMRKDGKDPDRVNRNALLRPSRRTAEIIARFFEFSTEQVLSSIRSQRRVMGILYSPTGVKRALTRALCRGLKIPGHLEDLFTGGKEDPACSGVCGRLEEFYAQALAIYPELARNLMGILAGTEEAEAYFDYDFEGTKP